MLARISAVAPSPETTARLRSRAEIGPRRQLTKGLKKVLQKRLLDALGVPEGASLEFKGS